MRKGYGHMVHDYYVAKLREMHQERTARLETVSSPKEARAYQKRVKEAIRRAFQPTPAKTPLNPRITGIVERPQYRIEKVLLESRPGFLVTANLYIPHDLQGPAPAVLGTCGHSANGNPINQGERDQYARLSNREVVVACTRAHNMMGKQLELVGEYFGMWRAWDGIRALDYLLSRPEVDPKHVGLTGNSGGGTMTTWLWAIEDPGCFVTTFLRNLENELPADCEQYPPGVLGAGLEMADFLIARAPLPVLLLGQHYDYFDRRGHQEACDELRRFYQILGVSESRVGCFRGDHPHGYHRENQQEMVDFFAFHAGLEPVNHVNETEVLEDKQLYATPTGEVIEAGNKPVYEFIAERADELLKRPPLTVPQLKEKLAELLQLPEDRSIPNYRNLRPVVIDEMTYGRYAIDTERNVRAILRKKMAEPAYAHSLDVGNTVHLYLPHASSEEDLASDPLALSLQEKGELYALDVRGLGESMPDEEGAFWASYGMDYMYHGHGLLFRESYLGRRVYDTLRTLDLLSTAGAQQIHLYGRGQGALIALFAALLHPQVKSVTLKNAPHSYQEWTQVPLVGWPAANFLPHVLEHFDLEDCVRALGDSITIIEPWDAQM